MSIVSNENFKWRHERNVLENITGNSTVVCVRSLYSTTSSCGSMWLNSLFRLIKIEMFRFTINDVLIQHVAGFNLFLQLFFKCIQERFLNCQGHIIKNDTNGFGEKHLYFYFY